MTTPSPTAQSPTTALRPILVVMSWRGGDRFLRCLDSIAGGAQFFSRIVLSITSSLDSDDMRHATAFAAKHEAVEVICTGRELPTMEHQAFWVDHLQATGATSEDWIFWLAYDDQIRVHGIEALLDSNDSWPLEAGTAYFGPWAMRHEQADALFAGQWDEPLESWTSFEEQGPLRLPVLSWIGQQLKQPTYMQMSGSVCSFACFVALRDARPRKTGPMRIEMAIAASRNNTYVAEFPEPVTIIYGRSNSDRANYAKVARKEDVHLAAWLIQYARRDPAQVWRLTRAGLDLMAMYSRVAVKRAGLPAEEWRVRGTVKP